MSGHHKTLSAVFPVLLKTSGGVTQILLHRRQNTGYADGKWDIAGSGHVDAVETARMAAVRECHEELGITVTGDLAFAHLSHRFCPDRVYYDIYFLVGAYDGTPAIMEPEKASALAWFDVHALPEDTIPCRREDIQSILRQIPYSEKIEG